KVQLKFVETIREESGLALSSRNAYFSPEDRAKAAVLYHSLNHVSVQTRANAQKFQTALFEATEQLSEAGFELDYLDLVDPITMKQTTPDLQSARLIVAGRFRNVRLIDNIPLYL